MCTCLIGEIYLVCMIPLAKWLLHDIRRRTRDTQANSKVRDRENEVNNGDTLRR